MVGWFVFHGRVNAESEAPPWLTLAPWPVLLVCFTTLLPEMLSSFGFGCLQYFSEHVAFSLRYSHPLGSSSRQSLLLDPITGDH